MGDKIKINEVPFSGEELELFLNEYGYWFAGEYVQAKIGRSYQADLPTKLVAGPS